MPRRSSRGRGKSRSPRVDGAAPEPAIEALPVAADVPAEIAPPDAASVMPPRAIPVAPRTVVPPPPFEPGAIAPSSTLSDALGEVVAQSRRRAAAESTPGSTVLASRRPVPTRWLLAALGGWLVVGWLLLAPPAIARGPADHAWAPAPALAEASLRYGLWLARARVDALVRAEGRVPARLADVGVVDTSLTLVVTGQRAYRLEGRQGPLRLSLTSTMAADSFLGSGLEQLRR